MAVNENRAINQEMTDGDEQRQRREGVQNIGVGVVERLEGLRLNRVEESRARLKDRLELRLLERGERKRLQIEQIRVRRIFLGQNQMPEGDRQRGDRAEPTIAAIIQR